jgi:hypothetical protein
MSHKSFMYTLKREVPEENITEHQRMLGKAMKYE